jgi:hypothetical protein
VQQEMNHVLAYPFFGRQNDKFPADFVKYRNLFARIAKPEIVIAEVESLHIAKKRNPRFNSTAKHFLLPQRR